VQTDIFSFKNHAHPTPPHPTEYEVSRDAVYRHARAVGLFGKRQKNVRAALEKIIEQAAHVEVNAAAVVSAVSAYAKINASGQWINRSETVGLNQLFERMTRDELELYAHGRLATGFRLASTGGRAE
jgi:hypothetical protein